MATDKTMPPGDPASMSPSSPVGAPPAGPGGPGGDVMISLPKAAFDAMHQIVMQLSSGLDQLAKDVNKQAAGGAGMPPMEEEMGEPGGMSEKPAGGAGSSPEDEEFLRSMMEEGNSKTR